MNLAHALDVAYAAAMPPGNGGGPASFVQMLLPFGVFLGLGAVAALLFGAPLVEWYAGQFR